MHGKPPHALSIYNMLNLLSSLYPYSLFPVKWQFMLNLLQKGHLKCIHSFLLTVQFLEQAARSLILPYTTLTTQPQC